MLSTFGEKVVFRYYHFCMKDGLYIMHGTAQTLIRETQQLKECRERFLAVTDVGAQHANEEWSYNHNVLGELENEYCRLPLIYFYLMIYMQQSTIESQRYILLGEGSMGVAINREELGVQ
jgi:hypothetical protein